MKLKNCKKFWKSLPRMAGTFSPLAKIFTLLSWVDFSAGSLLDRTWTFFSQFYSRELKRGN